MNFARVYVPPISDILHDNPQQMILRDGFIFENK